MEIDLTTLALAADRPRPGSTPGIAPKQAAEEFDAYLVGVLLKSASQPLLGESLLDGGPGAKLYRDQYYEELARLAVERGDLRFASVPDATGGEGAQ
ncbi:MAG: hypothetical protein MJE66_01000 [Proteobacteria bacterium]|nr:hypothetical protein [Pseudomonadota bacterium]